MSQPKGAIFSHGKKWMVSTGWKHHKIMRKQRFQHLKAIFSHFMHSVVHGSHTNNDIPIHLGQVLKWQKIVVGNIFYHFLFAVSLGNRASKMSEKFRIDRKIGFQNTFYIKCINVIIDSIGPSIILRSIYILEIRCQCRIFKTDKCWSLNNHISIISQHICVFSSKSNGSIYYL